MQAFGETTSILEMALSSGPVVGAAMLLLLAASVLTWTVIFFKYMTIKNIVRENKDFSDIFSSSCENVDSVLSLATGLNESSLAAIFRCAVDEIKKPLQKKVQNDENENIVEIIKRSLQNATESQILRLENALVFLSTAATASPLIGLFGTVWGIMNAFREISASGSANLAVIAPGISEALITTAAGLTVAIPAALAYNYFNNCIRVMATEMDAFSSDFLNLMSRNPGAAKQKA